MWWFFLLNLKSSVWEESRVVCFQWGKLCQTIYEAIYTSRGKDMKWQDSHEGLELIKHGVLASTRNETCAPRGGQQYYPLHYTDHGSLQMTQRHWRVRNKNACVKGLSEPALDCVQMAQCASVREDTVEGQHASRPVQIHTYSVAARASGMYEGCLVFVVDRVFLFVFIAEQAPGIFITSKFYRTTL